MKKHHIILSAVLCMSILTGCVQAPDELPSSESSGETAEAKVVYLDGTDKSILENTYKMPFYEGKDYDDLKEIYLGRRMQNYVGFMSAMTPGKVLFAYNQLVYDKLTGRISRACKDPQCGHIRNEYYECLFNSGRMCSTTSNHMFMTNNTIGLTNDEIGFEETGNNYMTDLEFENPQLLDLDPMSVVVGETDDGRLIVTTVRFKEIYKCEESDSHPYNDRRNRETKVLLYDIETKKKEDMLALNGLYLFYYCGGRLYLWDYYDSQILYLVTEDLRSRIEISKTERLTAIFDKCICYIDPESGDSIKYDTETGEKSLFAKKDSPMTRIEGVYPSADYIYYYRYHTDEEIDALDFMPDETKEVCKSSNRRASIIYRCLKDGTGEEIVIYCCDNGSPENMFSYFIDDGVIYVSTKIEKTILEEKFAYDRFRVYDIESEKQLIITFLHRVDLSEYY